MKALTFVVTALVNLCIGAAWIFMLMLAVKDFTAEQSKPAFILFIVWGLLTAILVGTLGHFSTAHFIRTRDLPAGFTSFMMIVIFTIVGAAIDFIGFIIAVALTTSRRF